MFLAFSNPHDINPYYALLCIAANVLGPHCVWTLALQALTTLHLCTSLDGSGAKNLCLASRYRPQLWQ